MRFPVLATLLLACLPAFSEGAGKERACRIIFPDRPRDAPTEVHLFDGTASRKVELPSMNFSEVILGESDKNQESPAGKSDFRAARVHA